MDSEYRLSNDYEGTKFPDTTNELFSNVEKNLAQLDEKLLDGFIYMFIKIVKQKEANLFEKIQILKKNTKQISFKFLKAELKQRKIYHRNNFNKYELLLKISCIYE